MRDYDFYYTQDGSVGLYSYADNDVYHSKFGALTEAWDKFVLPSGISSKLNKVDEIKVLDVCYGIGYNTKALMSFIINSNEKKLEKENFLKKIIKKFFKKKSSLHNSIVSVDTNKIKTKKEILLEYTETINNENINKLSEIKIDCLDINKELIKISPLLKTVITPQEVFSRIVPRIFDCFETYWKIKRFLSRIAFKFTPKNKKEIKELLDLKFNNDYDAIENEYRIHKFVNYILIDKLVEQYGNNYIDENIKKILKDKSKKQFFDKAVLSYARFLQKIGYKLYHKTNLSAFLHNIYYDHLSNRYKKAKFKLAEKLFKINFYADDARKSILNLKGHYDLIFLDAFTFSKAPELWTVDFMAELYSRLSSTGVLMTYSNSALVRNTLLENNFYVGKILDKKTNKFIGTIAAKEKGLIEHPLSNYEIGLCNTKAGIPYRDPSLSYTKEEILKNREIAFKESDLPTSSQYMRIRSKKGIANDSE